MNLKSTEKSTKSKPCSNRPVKCEHCSVIVWTYNIEQHYLVCHQGVDIPVMISEKEQASMKALDN
jgi:acetyl-CoA carboxylase beta subunit